MSEVSNSIKKLRQEKKLSQEELAEKLYVTRQAVSNWENGKTQPDIDTITKLANIFDVSVERIIYGKAKSRFHFAVNVYPQKVAQDGIGLGAVLAVVISYVKWQSIGWAILHGILGWIYVIYYLIKY
ncbi:MAG: helix-turn-helix transcriptional regulator [Clostridia bacterium]|nr:helix-turn-helix transcriptional regulator [Clostridia bacterium]